MSKLNQKELEHEPRIRIRPEYCDVRSCPARAKRVVLTPNATGDEQLSFCNHHYKKFELKLVGHIIELDECGL